MSTVVVGSVALDTIKTDKKNVEEVLGGSASYFSYSSSFFTDTKMVAVVGNDFPKTHYDFLRAKNIDLEGLAEIKGKTFRWSGEYKDDMNTAITHETQLNVFEDFDPFIPESYKKCSVLFLANIDPQLQMMVLDEIEKPHFVACDTMNLWIDIKKKVLKSLIKKIDLLIVNDGEAKQLTACDSTIKAVYELLTMGPKFVVVKKGEHGVIVASNTDIAVYPAYPLQNVTDPTGAGDSFAGGMIGWIDKSGAYDFQSIKEGVLFGTVMASFAVEGFSLDGLTNLDKEDIMARYSRFCDIITPERV
ncbi:MAG: sugar kinase [Candidatus Aureabacteria bacterium]|nr:sugar kinase [Candidatus Auribacterota bacterium]